MRANNNQGFTLIETLVYLALFALMIGGLVVAAYMLFESSDRNQTKAILQEEENFIMAKIMRALDDASAASVSGSTLSIVKYDATSVSIHTSGGDVYLDGNRLNNANVTIGNLSFVHSGGGSDPESVEIDLTATAKTPDGMTITQSASTTRSLRK